MWREPEVEHRSASSVAYTSVSYKGSCDVIEAASVVSVGTCTRAGLGVILGCATGSGTCTACIGGSLNLNGQCFDILI